MSPRWLFFPTPAAAGPVLSFSGTLTNASSGPATSSTSFTGSPSIPTGMTSIQMRSDGFRLGFIFNSTTNRNAFVSSYPAATNIWTLTLDGDVGTTIASWSWNTSVSSTRAYITSASWSSWPSNYLYSVGDPFTLVLE